MPAELITFLAVSAVLMAAFFTSSLPQFMTLTWLTAYAVAVAKTRGLFARIRIRSELDAAAGAVLAFGIGLATSQR